MMPWEAPMSDANREQGPREVEELTTAIREMASRVSAQFVLDDKKAQNFIAAGEQREQVKKKTE
jgi:hypothetical protein